MLDQPLRGDPGHEIVPGVDALAPVVAERKGQALGQFLCRRGAACG